MISTIREQWALLVIALGAIFGAWTLYTQPALQGLREAEFELMLATDERDELAEQPEVRVPIKKGPTVESVLALRFGSEDLLGEQSLLNTIAGECGVSIGRIDPSGQTETTRFGPLLLQGSSLKIEASGRYGDIAKFLSVLSDSQGCVIEDLSLSTQGQGGVLEFSVQLNTASFARRGGAIAEGEVE